MNGKKLITIHDKTHRSTTIMYNTIGGNTTWIEMSMYVHDRDIPINYLSMNAFFIYNNTPDVTQTHTNHIRKCMTTWTKLITCVHKYVYTS